MADADAMADVDAMAVEAPAPSAVDKAPKAKRGRPPGSTGKKAAAVSKPAKPAPSVGGDESGAAVDDRIVQLPLARIRRIVRTDPDVANVASDAMVAIAKATEIFLQAMAELAHHESASSKRKTVQYDDLAKVVKRYDNLEFLRDVVPERVPVSKAKERRVAIAALADTPLGVTATAAAAAEATAAASSAAGNAGLAMEESEAGDNGDAAEPEE